MSAGSEQTGTRPLPSGIDWGKVSLVVIMYAVLFAGTAVVFSVEHSGRAQRIPANTLYGPFQIKRANQLVTFQLVHYSPTESWAYIDGEVLNAEKKVIMRFGGDYYHESGYDGGRWVERQKQQNIVTRFPIPGQYYLRFSVETGAKYSRRGINTTSQSAITVRIVRHLGGSGMLDYIAIFLIILAWVLLFFQNKQKFQGVAA